MTSGRLPSTVAGPHRLVRASAGTGKTYALTVRFLSLVAAGAEPETILATTFTRKAAGEILGRALLRLAEASVEEAAAAALGADLGLPDGDCRRWGSLLDELCSRLHRLQIGTLDSFFYRMVRCFRLELGLPARTGLAAVDDPATSRLRAAALDATLEELAEEDWELLLELLDRLRHGAARRSVAGLLDVLFTGLHDLYRQVPEPAPWYRLGLPSVVDASAVEEAIEELEELAALPPAGLGSVLRSDLDDVLDGRWQRFLSKGLAKPLAEDPPRRSYRGKPISRRIEAIYRPLVARARGALLGQIGEQTAATHEILHRFDRHMERLCRRERLLLWSDLALKLAHQLPALGDERLLDIYYRLDARVAHLLIDEFQDTSLEQWQVLQPLAEEIRAYGDGSRTLFVVGDPKQAIYGWRGGCAELFGEVEALLDLTADGEDVQRTSYRTSPVVLEAIDRVFGRLDLLPALSPHREAVRAWAQSYVPLEAADPERPGHVQLLTSVVEEDGGEEWGHDRFVVETVAGLCERVDGSIGLLVWTNRAARRLLDLLAAAGLRASGEGGGPIVDDPAVVALLAALTLADHPGDRVAAYHVARSPLGGLLGLGHDPLEKDAEVVARGLRRRLMSDGLARLLSGWARQLWPGLPERSRARVGQLVELADRFEPAAGLRPHQFARYVQAATVEEPSPSRIRVMTVHKAKGLEFDFAVLGQLDRSLLQLRDQLLDLYRPSPTAPVEGVYRRAKREVRERSAELRAAYEQSQRRRLWDDLSGLYVAMTRARCGLTLIVQPRRRGRQVLTHANLLLQALLADPSSATEPRQLLFEAGSLPAGRAGRHRAPSAPAADGGDGEWASRQPLARRPRRLGLVRPSRRAEASGKVRASDLLRLEDPAQRRRGGLLHLWLEQVAWLEAGETGPEEAELRRIALARYPDLEEDWLGERVEELRRMLRQPQITGLFVPPPRVAKGDRLELWRERPFAQVQGDRLLHGVFDRVVIHRRGGRVLGAELFELKSDRLDPQEVESAVETYRPQIESYRAALAGMLELLPTAVRARLVLLDAGLVREI